ncbi:WD40 repeat-like protein [Mycena sanguinolenta]|uniref:WD40 repeat-like protein n=1 Tax=Mycena sanguinolenta TaxID=230812 RepID=A0A8H7DG03_9AGAR|nr:WD40 repeat-like protein [Mycena sanguinolenta]
MARKEQMKPSNFWNSLRGKLKGSANIMEAAADASHRVDGQIHIEAVYGGTGGSGGSGAYGGAGGTGQGPHFSGVMHVNKIYGTTRQAYTMLLPWSFCEASLHREHTHRIDIPLATVGKQQEEFTHILAQCIGVKNTVLGLHFFCSRDDEKARSHISIIPTIAHQLLSLSKPFAKFIEGVPIDVIIPASSHHVEELLVRPWCSVTASQPGVQLRKTKPVVVVIDALDEIENDQGSALVKQLIQAVSGSNQLRGLKLLITSRPHPQILNECSSISQRAVYHIEDIDPKQASQDIRHFLNAELPDLSPQQLEDITLDSGGLFIYASTIVRYLHPPNLVLSPNQKAKRLNMLKTTGHDATRSDGQHDFHIDLLYKDILTEALVQFSEEMDIAKHVLYCVVTTRRPLRVSDLAPLVVDVTGKPDEVAVHNSLQLFYAVLYVSRHDKCIYTFHKSFADFILDPVRSPEHANPARSYFGNRTRNCLAIMDNALHFNMCNLTSSFLLDEEDGGLTERVASNIGPELRYACQYWAAHLISVHDPQDMQQLSEVLLKFCSLKARNWALLTPNAELNLSMAASQRLWALFVQGQAIKSTPQLYISSLATELAMPSAPDSPALHRGLVTCKHSSSVLTVAMSSTGIHIVSGLNDGTIQVWDAATGLELMKLEGHRGRVKSVAFSLNGTQILSGSGDKTVRIWDATTGNQVIKMEGHSDEVNSVAFSPNGTQIVSGSDDNTIWIWYADTGNSVMKIKGHADSVRSVAFSPNGAQIVSGSNDNTVQIWDVSKGNKVMKIKGHTHRVMSVAFSPNGAQIVSGSDDKTVRIWDATTGNQFRKMAGHSDQVKSVAFSPNGAQIVSGSHDLTVRIWDTATGNEVTKIEGHTGSVWSVAFSPNGAQILSGSDDNTVRIWDAATGNEVKKMEGHSDQVKSVAFSPNGTQIVSGAYDKTVRIWDTTTGNEIMKIAKQFHRVWCVAFSPNGAQIVSGSSDNTVQIWDATTGNKVTNMEGHSDEVNSVAFSPNGTQIVSGSSDRTVRIWDVTTGNEVMKIMGHTDWVWSVAFSPNRAQIVSGSGDKTVRICDATTGNEVMKIKGHTDWVRCVGFSPNGAQIVSGSDDNTVQIWDVTTGNKVMEIEGHTGIVLSVAFSPNGAQIVSGSIDQTVRIWDATTGSELMRIEGHTGSVWSVAFSPNGAQIVSGSGDKTVRIWDATTGNEATMMSTRLYQKDGWVVLSENPHVHLFCPDLFGIGSLYFGPKLAIYFLQ